MGKLKALQSCPSLSKLTATELALLAAVTELRELSSDDILFEEGGESDSLYIIAAGELVVGRQQDGDKPLLSLKSGDSLGELSLLHPTTHRLSAKVSTATATIAVISHRGAQQLLEARPAIGRKLFAAVSNLLHDKMQSALQ